MGIFSFFFGDPKPDHIPTHGPVRLPREPWEKYKAFRESLGFSRRENATLVPFFMVAGRVNSAQAALDDIFIYTKDGWIDDWRVPNVSEDGKLRNDCDGYTGYLKQELLRAGLAPNWLSVATCWIDPDDFHSYHMVLLVHCEDGTYVCDNTETGVWRWHQRGFKYDYMESPSGIIRIG